MVDRAHACRMGSHVNTAWVQLTNDVSRIQVVMKERRSGTKSWLNAEQAKPFSKFNKEPCS